MSSDAASPTDSDMGNPSVMIIEILYPWVKGEQGENFKIVLKSPFIPLPKVMPLSQNWGLDMAKIYLTIHILYINIAG
jgi:hypothetical protein